MIDLRSFSSSRHAPCGDVSVAELSLAESSLAGESSPAVASVVARGATRLAGVLLIAVGLLASGGFATPATAQQWEQTARVMADVERGQAPSAFLDSLTRHLRHRDTMAVRRSPDDVSPMTKEALVDSLLDEGFGLQSANRMVIEYEFEIVDNELIERIQNLYFFYRPVGPTESDIPILYVNAEREVVADLLRTSGIADERNLELVHAFTDELSFPSLSLNENATIIGVGGETIRGRSDQRRRVLVRQLKAFIYDRDKVYTTRVVESET